MSAPSHRPRHMARFVMASAVLAAVIALVGIVWHQATSGAGGV